MKEVNFFTHDYNARNDPKLIDVQMDMGGQGLAIWWCLVEMLWEQDGYIPRNYKSLAFCLRWATAEEVRHLVEDFDLFEMDDEKFWNNSALARKELRDVRKNAQREGGRKGARIIHGRDTLMSNPQDSQKQAEGNPQGNPQDSQKQAATIHTYIHTDIHTNNSSSCAYTRTRGEEEKEQVFKIFFFKNFTKPDYEVDRFWNYYEGRSWKWGDQEIENIEAVAKQWTPEVSSAAYPPDFIEWMKKVYELASSDNKLSPYAIGLLRNVVQVSLSGKEMRVIMRGKEWGERMKYAGGLVESEYRVDYRFTNR